MIYLKEKNEREKNETAVFKKTNEELSDYSTLRKPLYSLQRDVSKKVSA
jgi:hypothetical protein